MSEKAKMAMALAVLLLISMQGSTQDVDSLKSCTRCHGQDGNSSKPPTPSIAGLARGYIAASLQSYQDGSRQCGMSSIKCKMASRWTDEQITYAAEHFSAQPRTRAPQEFDTAKAALGKTIHDAACAGCHSGADDGEEGGLLTGQWREYLEYTMEQYRAGGRSQPEGMKAATSALDEGEWDALLHYYASGP